MKEQKLLGFVGRENYLFFLGGVGVLILGFIFLSIGPWDSFWSLTLAPILLIIGYIILIPLSILYKKKKGGDNPGG
ncbi:hypothetical protein ISS37_02660 [candidate division KSB1 bacterium]|nr:hypothetical protein [candidate division KSB1 bacterium]